MPLPEPTLKDISTEVPFLIYSPAAADCPATIPAAYSDVFNAVTFPSLSSAVPSSSAAAALVFPLRSGMSEYPDSLPRLTESLTHLLSGLAVSDPCGLSVSPSAPELSVSAADPSCRLSSGGLKDIGCPFSSRSVYPHTFPSWTTSLNTCSVVLSTVYPSLTSLSVAEATESFCRSSSTDPFETVTNTVVSDVMMVPLAGS